MTYQRTRGNSRDRRLRKLYLLREYGDGELTICYRCGVPLVYEDLTVDRILPGCQGGTYVRSNIRPSCSPCATETGNELKQDLLRNELTSVQKHL